MIETREKTARQSRERMENSTIPTMFKVAEVSQMLNVTQRTILTYIKDGKLKAVKVGGKWLVSEDEIQRVLRGE